MAVGRGGGRGRPLAGIDGERAARRERAAGDPARVGWDDPGMALSGAPGGRPGSAWRRALVYGWCGSAKRVAVGAVSTTRAAYRTAIRSAIDATVARLCEMNRIENPRSAWSRLSSRTIPAAIVTSRAVVGSSAMSSAGSAGEGHRDHRPLEHAAGQLVRIRPGDPLGVRQADLGESLGHPLPGGAHPPNCSRTTCSIWRPTGNTGLKAVVGLWKIIPTRRPRSRRRPADRALPRRHRRT